MDVVDLLVTIVVVTILVTIVLAVVTYVAYKLRLSREPAPRDDDPEALRYFVPYPPPPRDEEPADGSLERPARDATSREGHATEA
jgi:hypothetical protein